ncbi:MAG: cytochrome c family protein [Melioribacteraceae bacterium]|nr:cytochrome c family protein [Melioribacteraceae bacterium]
MKKLFAFLLLSAFVVTSYGLNNNGDDKKPGFIGAAKCGMCHKKEADGAQLKIWQESAHANAYKNIAKLNPEALKNNDCMQCHTTGAGSDASLNDKKFSIEDGVQCESCHGAGSEYKSMKVMKDRAASVAAGLVVWENEKQIEEMCLTCHSMDAKKKVDPKHPEAKWDFATMYKKIEHNKPAK